MSTYLEREGMLLNVRRPSLRAAALNRALMTAGMTSWEAAPWSMAATPPPVSAILAVARRLGVPCSRKLATHALAEWRACYAALPEEFKAEMRTEMQTLRVTPHA